MNSLLYTEACPPEIIYMSTLMLGGCVIHMHNNNFKSCTHFSTQYYTDWNMRPVRVYSICSHYLMRDTIFGKTYWI